jgi:hypothetical protein
MERVLLGLLGGSDGSLIRHSRPPVSLSDLDARLSFLQNNALDPSTIHGYAVGARDYIRFCLQHNLPLDPTPLTLARYIAYTSQFIASGPGYLTGVRHYLQDLFPDFDAARAHPLVKSTIRGSRKVRADPVNRKLPLRTSHLLAFLYVAIHSRSYDDLLFITILACAFYGCHRIGELVPASGPLFDWRKIIKRDTLHFWGNRVQYRLPFHKGDPFFRGTDILFTPQEIADPVTLLKIFTQIRDRLHGARSPLFLRENGKHPTRAWFEKKFFILMDHSYGGQSARAGGATFYAGLGISEDVLQAIGRWSSAAWKIYIREHPAIRIELQLATLHPHRLHY